MEVIRSFVHSNSMISDWSKQYCSLNSRSFYRFKILAFPHKVLIVWLLAALTVLLDENCLKWFERQRVKKQERLNERGNTKKTQNLRVLLLCKVESFMSKRLSLAVILDDWNHTQRAALFQNSRKAIKQIKTMALSFKCERLIPIIPPSYFPDCATAPLNLYTGFLSTPIQYKLLELNYKGHDLVSLYQSTLLHL